MGDQEVHPAPAGQESGLASYTIVTCPTCELPEGDVLSFIISKFLRSLRKENDFYALIDPKAYWENYAKYIKKILSGRETLVRLAVLTDDNDVILGFSLYRGNLLDYVYVQTAQRNLGIATRLLPHGIDTITHLTKAGLSIWGNKYGSWKFNPFA